VATSPPTFAAKPDSTPEEDGFEFSVSSHTRDWSLSLIVRCEEVADAVRLGGGRADRPRPAYAGRPELVAEVSAVVEGMDLDALRAGIDWRFPSFAEYMNMLRSRGPYMNLGVLVGPGSSCRGSS
jgi:hypothetical protein